MEIILNPDNFVGDNKLREDKRKEGKELFDNFLKCADGRFIVEFNISYLRLLLDPEGYYKNLASMNLTLGNGAGEEEPDPPKLGTGAGSGGRRRHTKKSHRRSKHKLSRRRK